jgi:flagellar hook-basal body complex protein FliE
MLGAAAPATTVQPGTGNAFAKVMDRLLGEANTQQMQADRAVQDLAAGKVDNLHEALLSVAKADLSFRLVLEVRNRLTDAYQEVMRMAV